MKTIISSNTFQGIAKVYGIWLALGLVGALFGSSLKQGSELFFGYIAGAFQDLLNISKMDIGIILLILILFSLHRIAKALETPK